MTAAAEAGLRDHDRLFLARQALSKLAGRQSSSHLPELVDLVFRKPLLCPDDFVRTRGHAAGGRAWLVEELNLREMTGRGRFRAWGVL